MAVLRADALLCTVRAHGEHGAIIRALTADHGLVSGYIRGGRSRAMRPVLISGNIVALELRARTSAQLAGASAELVTSRAPLLDEPIAAAGLEWATALTGATLPEDLPFPVLHGALDGLLAAISAAPAARGWAGAIARYELLLLEELGFGLMLDECVATGARDHLTHVSPRSGGAVSAAAAKGLEDRLFPLPSFLISGGGAGWADILAALRLTGHFIDRALLTGRRDALGDARVRLVGRLERAVA